MTVRFKNLPIKVENIVYYLLQFRNDLVRFIASLSIMVFWIYMKINHFFLLLVYYYFYANHIYEVMLNKTKSCLHCEY